MTTAPLDAPPQVRPSRRILNVARLHTTNAQTYLGIPWIITVVAFGFSFAIALIIPAVAEPADVPEALSGMQYSWALVAPLWYLVIVGILAVSSTFSFALGLSATRREFFLGTALTFVVVSLINASGYAVLYAIEQATDGFGIGMHHFTSLWLSGDQSVAEAFFTFFVAFFSVVATGAAFATVWMRWKSVGVVTVFIILAMLVFFVIGAAVALTGATDALASWAMSLSLTEAFLVVLAVSAGALALSWPVLRRAPARI